MNAHGIDASVNAATMNVQRKVAAMYVLEIAVAINVQGIAFTMNVQEITAAVNVSKAAHRNGMQMSYLEYKIRCFITTDVFY